MSPLASWTDQGRRVFDSLSQSLGPARYAAYTTLRGSDDGSTSSSSSSGDSTMLESKDGGVVAADAFYSDVADIRYSDRANGHHSPPTSAGSRLPLRISRLGRMPLLSAILLVVLAFGYVLHIRTSHTPPGVMRPAIQTTTARNVITFSNGTVYDRPPSLKIVGLIFYGRRQFTDILDCYLRRNLAVNGGLLDEIRFVMHTRSADDQKWLEDLVAEHHLEGQYVLQYEDTGAGWSMIGSGFRNIWSTMQDPEIIFVKIDDDMVYIDDQAIPEMLRALIEHPEAYAVVPNVVNNAFTYWYHHRNNAIHPYLPEQKPPAWPFDTSTWRASELPPYADAIPNGTEQFYRHDTYRYPFPFRGHRWLPLRDGSTYAQAMGHTPFNNVMPNVDGMDYWHTSWALAAQSHYSFFENYERDTLGLYNFGSSVDGLQNLWYSHYSINVVAIRGSSIGLMTEVPEAKEADDEILMTRVVPRRLRMPVLLASRAIVNHYAYGFDRADVLTTDALDRYRALANEDFCAPTNRKKAFDVPPT